VDLPKFPPGVLEGATEARLRAAAGGTNEAHRITVAQLAPGLVGVLDVEVVHVVPTRHYQRKRGGEGSVGRLRLSDSTGEIDLVLWDEETAILASDWVQPGARLWLAGATVKAGQRGGLELGLGAGRLVPVPDASAGLQTLVGDLLSIGPTRIVGEGAALRFQADVEISGPRGVQRLVVTGPVLLQVRGLTMGLRVAFSSVRPNPSLEGWWWSTPSTSCVPSVDAGDSASDTATPAATSPGPRNP
jgi:hypothetical protein